MVQKLRTSINLSRNLLADIRASGIRNISKYFEDLARSDIYNVTKLTKNEQTQLNTLNAELLNWRKEWASYIKRTGDT